MHRMPSTNSFQMTPEEKAQRAHKLKLCEKCNTNTDPLGGVEVRSKWHCAKCWVRYLNNGR